LINSKLFCL